MLYEVITPRRRDSGRSPQPEDLDVQSIYEQRNFVMSNREKFLRKWRMKSINDDRGKIIRDTEFSKSEHYIPLFVQDSSNKAPNYLNKAAIDIQGNELNNSRKGLLFVADWNNRDSKWT